MTLTFVTDFCAVKVQQISTHECFANVLNGDSKVVKSIGNILPMIGTNLGDHLISSSLTGPLEL